MPSASRDRPKLILASGSPRRSELIALTGWEVKIRPVNVDESERPGEDGLKLARRLAAAKVREAAARFDGDEMILAADTVVESRGKILGKPASGEEAREMLMRLRGESHQVHSAIALLKTETGELQIDACTTEVPMRAYRKAEVDAYVKSGSPLDKAGAYGIQGIGGLFVARVDGSPHTVVGLPVHRLPELFESHNLNFWRELD